MCRLFGMHAGPSPSMPPSGCSPLRTAWPQQSRREADGFGIGAFDPGGKPVVDKAPVAAYEDRPTPRQPGTLDSITFVAHVRYASTGGNPW